MENAGMACVALLINPFEFHVGRPVVMEVEIRICDCGDTGHPAYAVEYNSAFANDARYIERIVTQSIIN